MKKIMVIGDLMLDEYIHGKVNRMSPEAPVPIVDLTHIDYRPGGAANVVMNCRSIDEETEISIMGVVGDDDAGKQLKRLLLDKNINVDGISTVPEVVTTVKTRVIADNKQMLRMDNQSNVDVSEYLKDIDLDVNVVVFSDYDYGVIDAGVIKDVLERNNDNFVVIADPKKRNFWHYGGVDIFKPNQIELWEALRCKMSKSTLDINEICSNDLPVMMDELSTIMPCNRYLVTAGKDGMMSYDSFTGKWEILDAVAEEVYDVTGAGDTVTAVLADCVAEGISFEDAVNLSNYAAGKVVGRFGCSYVTDLELGDLKSIINTDGE